MNDSCFVIDTIICRFLRTLEFVQILSSYFKVCHILEREMRPAPLSISALPAWAKLHNVTVDGIGIKELENRGYGFVATRPLEPADPSGGHNILNVPQDLILSSASIEEHAKADKHFRELLDVAGGKARYPSQVTWMLN
jgi:hypothetical protein